MESIAFATAPYRLDDLPSNTIERFLPVSNSGFRINSSSSQGQKSDRRRRLPSKSATAIWYEPFDCVARQDIKVLWSNCEADCLQLLWSVEEGV